MCDLISVKHNFNKNDEYSHSSQKSLCNAICLKEKNAHLFPQSSLEWRVWSETQMTALDSSLALEAP